MIQKYARYKAIFLSLVLTCSCQLIGISSAATPRECFFKTSDGLRLHYTEAGDGEETLIFVPGWMMPAAVFDAQLAALSKHFRVIAFDPRSHGKSDVSAGAHTPRRRSQDLHELMQLLKSRKVILIGWSLGVMEVLDYLTMFKHKDIAGLVLIDNSIGMGRPPSSSKSSSGGPIGKSRESYLKNFIHGLTQKPMPAGMFEEIYASAHRMPQGVAKELINKPYPREHWSKAVLSQDIPILYVIRPRFEEQGRILAAKRPQLVQIELFPKAGHAIFIDEATKFNQLVTAFVYKIRNAQHFK
jgi:microsomal epoxide hydrolase